MMLVDVFRDVIVPRVQDEVLELLQEVDPSIETVHYEHGHYSEIHETLVQQENSPNHYTKKYPLIALLEDVGGTDDKGDVTERFTILICHRSINEYKSYERYQYIINPILVPIYESLKKQINECDFFYGYDVKHERYTHPYMGKPGPVGNVANLFSDVVDSIEMRNTRLKMYDQQDCPFPVMQ